MLNRQRHKPELRRREGNELVLSGADLSEFLRAVLERDLPVRFSSKGQSMFPFIKDGDRVTVHPKNAPLRLGDIAVFIHPVYEKLAIHRVIKKELRGYIMRGDYTHESDGFVPEKSVIGIVSEVQRRGRKKRLGFGPEKLLIAVFSRYNIFSCVYRFFILIRKPFRRKLLR